VRQNLRMLAVLIMMAPGAIAHAEQIDYDPAEVSDSLRAVFQFGSVSTRKALNANTVTLLTGTIGGTYVQFGADLASVLDDEHAVIVDVEPTPARTYDEVDSTKPMLDRTERRLKSP
jgi:TRAP-type uncharacterized transport system substrate-binding protein